MLQVPVLLYYGGNDKKAAKGACGFSIAHYDIRFPNQVTTDKGLDKIDVEGVLHGVANRNPNLHAYLFSYFEYDKRVCSRYS